MLDAKILDEISHKISGLIAASPAADLEKNLRPLLLGVFARLDLVTREEFDVQTQVLQRAREQLVQLEQRLAALEGQQANRD